MRYVKGKWRTFITIQDAKLLEDNIAEIKTYTCEGPTNVDLSSQSVYSRIYRIYLYPGTYEIIKTGNDWDYKFNLPINYYNAQIRLLFDYRNQLLPHCEITIKEISIQYLESYLWHCSHKHNIETRILPETVSNIIRCPKCGSNMKCDREPVLPQLRYLLEKYHSNYCIELDKLNVCENKIVLGNVSE